MNNIAVFRTSASASIGGGHVIRCLSLARELSDLGWSCIFGCEPETLITMPMIKEFDTIDARDNNQSTDAQSIGNKIGKNVSVLIVDHYHRDRVFETNCRRWAEKVVVIDDLANRSHDADLLLDQSGGRKIEEYLNLVPTTCEVITGPKYSLLRREFKSMVRTKALNFSARPLRIFVCMSATDINNLTPVVLSVISSTVPSAKVDILLSKKAPYLSMVKKICKNNQNFLLHAGISNPAEIMVNATLAIGSAGVNLWERCALGIPSIIFIAAENQRLNAEHVISKGGAIFGGEGAKVDHDKLAKTISIITKNNDTLPLMSKAALKICDGFGAMRVAQKIKSITKKPVAY